MFGYILYLAVQEQTFDFASEALPNAPVRHDHLAGPRPGQARVIRRRVSLALRALADRVEARPGGQGEPAPAGFR